MMINFLISERPRLAVLVVMGVKRWNGIRMSGKMNRYVMCPDILIA